MARKGSPACRQAGIPTSPPSLRRSFGEGELRLVYVEATADTVRFENNKIFKSMSHEIEADFKEYSENEERRCQKCTSYDSEKGYCSEAQAEVPAEGYCDFFQSID